MPQDNLEKILYGFFALLVCAGIFLLYKFYTLKPAGQGDIAPIAIGQLVKPSEWGQKKIFKKGPKGNTDIPEKKTPPPKMDIAQKTEIQSEISKQLFSKQAFLKVPLPGHLKYLDIEIEDGVKAVYGYNTRSKEGLTAAAREGTLTMDQVKQYIKEDKDSIPNLNGVNLSNISTVKNLPVAGKKKGIASVEVITADTDKGQQVHVALVNRTDKKGSYVFVYSGPKGSVDNNEGYLDKVFYQMEALSPPKPKK